MKCFLMICVLFFTVNAALAEKPDWVGVYTFDEESRDETRVRTSYWFRLEVKKSGGKLVGDYSEGVDGKTTRRFQASVKTEGKKARFYFEKRLPAIEGIDEIYGESEFAGGELLFELEKSTAGGKAVIQTIWHRMNPAARTETGAAGAKNVFFRKVSIKRGNLRVPEKPERKFVK
jgi:hypothetical protein